MRSHFRSARVRPAYRDYRRETPRAEEWLLMEWPVDERELMDRRWQLALDCLDAEESPFSKGTFVAFRTRLIEHQMDRRLLERTVEIAAASKAFGPRNLRAALDSSPLWGAGRVEDTYNLLGHALRKALSVIAREQGRGLAAIAAEADAELVAGASLKAALDLDWDEPSSREQALRQVIGTLERVEQWLAANPELITEGSVVPDCLAAARQVGTQDVQTNDAGEPTLIKGVAKDRRISIEDAEMRHGRKSRRVRVDGYKRHVMRDLDSELVVAVGITPANAPEASVAEVIKSDLSCTLTGVTCRAHWSASAVRSWRFSARPGRCEQASSFPRRPSSWTGNARYCVARKESR